VGLRRVVVVVVGGGPAAGGGAHNMNRDRREDEKTMAGGQEGDAVWWLVWEDLLTVFHTETANRLLIGSRLIFELLMFELKKMNEMDHWLSALFLFQL
jgi:hypothetical protein